MAFPSELQFESSGPARESFPFSPVHAAEDREFLSDSEDEISEIMSQPPAPPAKEEVKPLEIVMEPRAEGLKRVVVDREKAEKPQANPPNWFDDIEAMMDQPESGANGQLHFGFDEDVDNFPSRESLHSKPEEVKEWKANLMTAQRLPAGFSESQEDQRPLESEEKMKDDFFDALPDESNEEGESSLGDTDSELARGSSVNSSHPSLAVVSASIEVPAAKEDPVPLSFAPDSVSASLASNGKPRPLVVSSGGNLRSFAPDPQELSSARDRGGSDLKKGPDGGERKPLSISSESLSLRGEDVSGKTSLNPVDAKQPAKFPVPAVKPLSISSESLSLRGGDVSGKTSLNPTDAKQPAKFPVPAVKPQTFAQPIAEGPPADFKPPAKPLAKSLVPDKNWAQAPEKSLNDRGRAEAAGDRPATTISLSSPKLSLQAERPQFDTKLQAPAQGPRPLVISEEDPPDLSYKSPSSMRNAPSPSEVKPRVPLSTRAEPLPKSLQVPEGPKKPAGMSIEEPAGISLSSKSGKFGQQSEAPPAKEEGKEEGKEEAKEEVKAEVKAGVPPLSRVFGIGRSIQSDQQKAPHSKQRVKFDEGTDEPEAPQLEPGKLPPLRIDEDDPLPAPRRPEPQRKPDVQKPPLPNPAVKPPEKPENDNLQASAKPNPGHRVIEPRDSRLQRPEEEKKAGRLGPDPVHVSDGSEVPGILNYSQVYERVATEDVLAIPSEQPAPRGCWKALMGCCSSSHEIMVPEVKKAMAMLLGLSRRQVDPSKPTDLSLLASIWGHVLTNERFSLTGSGWVRLGFQSVQPLQQETVGTLGLLQVLFALSDARTVAMEMYGVATTQATAFPFASTSLAVTALALRVVKSGTLNEYFDRRQNVRDVFNALYLGIFYSWVRKQQASPGKVSLPDLEKEVRLQAPNFITEGRRQQH